MMVGNTVPERGESSGSCFKEQACIPLRVSAFRSLPQLGSVHPGHSEDFGIFCLVRTGTLAWLERAALRSGTWLCGLLFPKDEEVTGSGYPGQLLTMEQPRRLSRYNCQSDYLAPIVESLKLFPSN